MTPALLASAMMIASGSIHAIVNAIIKGRRSDASTTPSIMAGRAATDGVSALLLLPATMLVPLPTGAWTWLAASAVVHVVYLYAMVRAYTAADFSAVYPVLRGTAPMIVAIVMIGVIGEPATLHQIIGIALIGGAMVSLVIGRHLRRHALGWVVMTGAMTATYTIADAHGVRAAPNVASYIVWDFVLIGSLSVALFAALGGRAISVSMRHQWRPCTAAGALSVVTYGLALGALSLGPIAQLAALRETGMVAALLIAIVALGERVTWPRALAVAAILAGAVLIVG